MPRWSSFDVAADRRLVHRLNDGDKEALAALYGTYAERLYDYALSMTGEYKIAADIAHDTFIDASRRAARMRDHQRLRSWLYGAVRRRCVQRARSRVLFWEPDVEFGDHAAFAEAAEALDRSGKPTPASPPRRPRTPSTSRPPMPPGGETVAASRDLPSSAELRRLLEASVARLDSGDQEALVLAVRHGLLPAEIGTVLGISSRRAAARVTRSRTLLDAAYGTELMLATERCAAGRRTQPAVDPADAQAELIERSASLDAAARPTATESTAAESAATDSVATRSATTESAAAESAAAESKGGTVRTGDSRPVRPVRTPPRKLRRPASETRVVRSRRGASGIPFTAGRRLSGPGSAFVMDEHPHCADCERRARVDAASLLAFAPAPVLPGSLRHRVLHTAIDPELAGYRADIAARGGALTPAGLPSQPDMPSPFTKRWLFAGGGMAGALVTALLGVMLVGPGLGDSTIYWPPFRARPQPSISDQPPGQPQGGGGGRESPRNRSPQAPGVPPPGSPNGQGASPPGSSPSPSSPVPPEPGTLTVSPGRVELYMTKTAKVRVAASRGPVSWTATSSSNQITVSRPEGELPEDGTADITVTLRTHLINLPGEATVTFTDPVTGATRPVTVVWGASLL